MTRRPARRPRLRLQALESRLVPNGTPGLIKDVHPGTTDSNPTGFAGMGGFVYFAAAGATGGDELWRTDGTSAGTTLVADIRPGSSGSTPTNLTAVGNTLFFSANDGTTGAELWKSDGTAAGTQLVKDIRLGSNSSSPAMLTAVGNTLYFTATDATTGTELWKSDGTAAGTVEVADLTAGSASTTFDWLANVNGRLVFARETGSSTPKVDVYAVDPGGLTPIVSYTATVSDNGMALIGTRLVYHGLVPDPHVFNALDDTLYVVDTAAPSPSPVVLTSVLSGAFGYTKIDTLTAVGSQVFFDAITDVGKEPWVTDGTPAGTHLVKDIDQDTPTNNPSSNPTEYTDIGGIAYFAATTITSGRELWRSDGTEAGTYQAADVEAGDASSSPGQLVAVGGHLVFDTFVGYATTLRQYDPSTGQVVAFPGYGLVLPGPLFTIAYANAVYDDVLYMGEKVTADNVGVEPYRLEFDPIAPTITGFDADTGVPGDGLTADNTPRVLGRAAPGNQIKVYDQSTLLGTTTAGADGRWEFTTTALADGPHAFHARAVNLHGSESADSPALLVTIDTTAPAAPAVTGFADNSGSPTDNVTDDPTLTLSGTAEANAAIELFDGPTDLGGTAAGADGHWSFATANLPDGTHAFTATATDAAGNVSAASPAFPVVIDTAAPAAPAITGFSPDTGVAGDGLTDSPTPTLAGTAEPGSVVAMFDGLTPLGTATADAGGNWQFTTPTLADGSHDFTATTTDAAGNTSSASGAFTLAVDSVRPTATIVPAAGQPDPTSASPITFTVTFSKAVTGFTGAGVDLSGSTVGGTLVADVTGSGTDYTVTVTGMTGDGTLAAAVRVGAAIDTAGNSNTASASSSVHFDNVPPTVTVNQAAGQDDPTDGTPIQFTVTFSESVSGFDAADVSFAGSDNPGSLSAGVSGSGTDYTVTVTGMSGAQVVVVSIAAGAATDAVGNPNLASAGGDNTVRFNDIGVLEFSVGTFAAAEVPGTPVVEVPVTVTRAHGSHGAIGVDYATGDGTARTPGDYAPASGTLNWADGDTNPQTFFVSINSDGVNEGREVINLTLTNPTNQAILGNQSTARIVIAPSDGTVLDAKTPVAKFTDADGDLLTVRLGGVVGTATVYLTDGTGPISEIDLSGTSPTKSTLAVVAKKPKDGTGDGRVGLGAVIGGDLRTLSARLADLNGPGVQLAGRLGTAVVGNVLAGSGIGAGSAGTISVRGNLGGTIGLGGTLGTLLVSGSVLPGADVGATAVRMIRVRHDFGGQLNVRGTGVDLGKPALGTLVVGGTVRNALIDVDGNITSVVAAGFDGSRVWAGYNGTAFSAVPATIASVRVTGRSDGFAGSSLYADTFKTVTLASVKADNGGTPFGVFADTSVGRVTVSLPTRRTYPGAAAIGDFDVEVV